LEKANISFDINKYAIILKYRSEDLDFSTFLILVDENDQQIEPDSELGWISLHLLEGENSHMGYRKALAAGLDLLILRVPTLKQFYRDIFPVFLDMMRPFDDFLNSLNFNLDISPYLVYYLDEFLATFDDEFDCSAFVRATRIESDLYGRATMSQVKLNDEMADFCKEMNQVIVGAFQSQFLGNWMHDMRDYVDRMHSREGRERFKNVFGRIF